MRFTPDRTIRQIRGPQALPPTYQNACIPMRADYGKTHATEANTAGVVLCKEQNSYEFVFKGATQILFHVKGLKRNIENRIRLIRAWENLFGWTQHQTTYGIWNNYVSYALVRPHPEWARCRLTMSLFFTCLRGGQNYAGEDLEDWVNGEGMVGVDLNHFAQARSTLRAMIQQGRPWVVPGEDIPPTANTPTGVYNAYLVRFTQLHPGLDTAVTDIGGVPLNQIVTPSGTKLKSARRDANGHFVVSFR